MAKRHEEHEKEANHERWLVSYADFITLLFATFVALYAMSRSDSAKAKQVAEYMRYFFGSGEARMIPQQALANQAVPADQGSVPAKAGQSNSPEAGKPEFEEMKNRLEEFLITKGMLGRAQVRVEERGLVISLKEAGFFESGQSEVLPAAYEALGEVAKGLVKYRNPIRVEGHTDDRPIHSRNFPSNWELSTARATSVVELLVRHFGVDPGRVSAAGYGQYKPVAANDTAAGRNRNRRVDVVVLSAEAERMEPKAEGEGQP